MCNKEKTVVIYFAIKQTMCDNSVIARNNRFHVHCAFTDEIFDVENEAIKYHDIFEHFEAKQCPLLAGKPKLFFLQSCRGSELSVKCALLYVKNRFGIRNCYETI